jgi:biopolymer transport protein ExbD
VNQPPGGPQQPVPRAKPASLAVYKRELRRAIAKSRVEPEINFLNITAMMDMMTIILVFLLKNFSGSTQMITLDQNLQVPPSQTQLRAKEAVPVTITKRVILVEGLPVAPITNGKVDSSLKPDGENGYKIEPIISQLSKIANRERRVAELSGDKFASELMVVADQTTPYRLIMEVLYSCGQAGYTNYRLVVLKERE